MKRLAKYGMLDIAIRREKGLLIIICESPVQARNLFGFLSMWLWDFRYKAGPDRFELMVRVHRQGNQVFSLSPDHPSYRYTSNFIKDVTRFTTGSLLPDGQLAYLKESRGLVESYPSRFELDRSDYPSIAPSTKTSQNATKPKSDEPDYLSSSVEKIRNRLRSLFS